MSLAEDIVALHLLEGRLTLTEAEVKQEQKALLAKWKELVNMSANEIEKFLGTEEGKKAGLSRGQASDAGISRGRTSGKAIIRMLKKGSDKWNDNDWKWARKQVSFISRMRGNKGPLMKDGKMTRKLTSLLIWGHDPRK